MTSAGPARRAWLFIRKHVLYASGLFQDKIARRWLFRPVTGRLLLGREELDRLLRILLALQDFWRPMAILIAQKGADLFLLYDNY